MNSMQIKTIEQVRREFDREGLSFTEWARANGYPPYLVQQVMTGKSRGLRGKSHEIAVRLGLKDGVIRTKEITGGAMSE